MKKVLIVTLFNICLLISLSFSSTQVNAETNTNLNLREQEYLDELLEIDPGFNIEGEIVSVNKTVKALDNAVSLNHKGENSSDRAIGSAYMYIYIVVSRINDPGWDTFKISATATWKQVPTVRMQDAFAISWGGGFALEESSAIASYKSMGQRTDKTHRIADSPNQGVAYSVEASHYYGQALDWVRINARISKKDSTNKANVTAAYCHRKVSIGGIGVSFGSNQSNNISFNVVGAYDTMSNSTVFTY